MKPGTRHPLSWLTPPGMGAGPTEVSRRAEPWGAGLLGSAWLQSPDMDRGWMIRFNQGVQ